jgi:hypothetical protein
VSDPNIDPNGASLRAAAGSGNDVWVVGYDPGSGGNPRQTVTMHWDGSAWSVVPSPNVGSGSNELYGVRGGGNDIWAVGNVGFIR